MSRILEVESVSKSFGGVVANKAVTRHVEPGEIVGLIGPNGSGKTTLFNSIVGYHPIDGGVIRFEGREITRLRVPQIARLGLLRTFQQTRIYKRMSCDENMLISVSQADKTFRGMFLRSPPNTTDRAKQLMHSLIL